MTTFVSCIIALLTSKPTFQIINLEMSVDMLGTFIIFVYLFNLDNFYSVAIINSHTCYVKEKGTTHHTS